MLRVSIRRVRDGQVERLRAWLGELGSRRDEAVETFAQEGVRHEQAYVLDTGSGHVLVYAMELEDEEKARAAFEASTLPIDAEHREVMNEVLDGPAPAELLYDVRVED
jgi:hypothetical protein